MYGDYDYMPMGNGEFGAYAPGSSDLIAFAPTEDKLTKLMSQLDVAYCQGVCAGIKEERLKLRKILGI